MRWHYPGGHDMYIYHADISVVLISANSIIEAAWYSDDWRRRNMRRYDDDEMA